MGCELGLGNPDSLIRCIIAGVELSKKVASLARLDFVRHRRFKGFADYCYQYLLKEKLLNLK